MAHPAVVREGSDWRCGGWTVASSEGRDALVLTGRSSDESDGYDGLRALCVAHWTRHPHGAAPAEVRAGDDDAGAALSEWGLES
jgi:hypothetical protein